MQPVLQDLEPDVEEAAATLGATRLQTLTRVILPILAPAMLTGFALAFARAVGEYGSVIFIAGNLPYVSEIAPLLIIIRLEEFDYAGATAIGTIMLLASFAMLLVINLAAVLGPPPHVGLRRPTWPRPCAYSQLQAATDHRDAGGARPADYRWWSCWLGLFLLLPLVAVFVEALRQGVGAYPRPPSSSRTRWPRSG